MDPQVTHLVPCNCWYSGKTCVAWAFAPAPVADAAVETDSANQPPCTGSSPFLAFSVLVTSRAFPSERLAFTVELAFRLPCLERTTCKLCQWRV